MVFGMVSGVPFVISFLVVMDYGVGDDMAFIVRFFPAFVTGFSWGSSGRHPGACGLGSPSCAF